MATNRKTYGPARFPPDDSDLPPLAKVVDGVLGKSASPEDWRSPSIANHLASPAIPETPSGTTPQLSVPLSGLEPSPSLPPQGEASSPTPQGSQSENQSALQNQPSESRKDFRGSPGGCEVQGGPSRDLLHKLFKRVAPRPPKVQPKSVTPVAEEDNDLKLFKKRRFSVVLKDQDGEMAAEQKNSTSELHNNKRPKLSSNTSESGDLCIVSPSKRA